MTFHKSITGAMTGALFALAAAPAALAQDYSFNLQSFLPAQATIPSAIIDVWADKIEEESDGRIEIVRYPAMQLGGAPPELMDQVIDGVVDMTWTVVGYTPGRFPSTEVFELPFMVSDAGDASAAFWTMLDGGIAESEFSDVEVLGGWVHGPGIIHSDRPVATPADMNGMKIRGASRQINALLKELGATPVGMPVPAVPEALSKGVIDGTTIPWEVTFSLKVPELVDNHTEFTGNSFYVVTFVLVMNKDKFADLPEDLQAVIRDNSGLEFSRNAGVVMAEADGPARKVAEDRGNAILTLDAEQSAAWAEAAAPVTEQWIAEMSEKGIDGQALIDEAKALMAE